MELANSKAIPVTIFTGFLGAGKTTLLNRILNGNHGRRVAVLVNDFGSINIDADLVVGIENNGDVISLANGCVCCSIRAPRRAPGRRQAVGYLDRKRMGRPSAAHADRRHRRARHVGCRCAARKI